jgi:hypothetical protein
MDSEESTDKCTWKFEIMQGIRCIVWHHEAPQNDKERQKRRKVKQDLSAKNPEILIIDTKAGDGEKEICDIIFGSDKCEKWLEDFAHLYRKRKFSEQSKAVPGGHQRSWYKKSKMYIAITHYSEKKKLMIQPGNQEENQLLEWMKDFKTLSETFQCSNAETSDLQELVPDQEDSSDNEITEVKKLVDVAEEQVKKVDKSTEIVSDVTKNFFNTFQQIYQDEFHSFEKIVVDVLKQSFQERSDLSRSVYAKDLELLEAEIRKLNTASSQQDKYYQGGIENNKKLQVKLDACEKKNYDIKHENESKSREVFNLKREVQDLESRIDMKTRELNDISSSSARKEDWHQQERMRVAAEYRESEEKLRAEIRAVQNEFSLAQDEIIRLKQTIGAMQDKSDYTEVKKSY